MSHHHFLPPKIVRPRDSSRDPSPDRFDYESSVPEGDDAKDDEVGKVPELPVAAVAAVVPMIPAIATEPLFSEETQADEVPAA